MKNEWVEIPHIKTKDMRPGYYWFYNRWANGHAFEVFHVFKGWDDGLLVRFVDDHDATPEGMIKLGYFPIQRCSEPPFVLPAIVQTSDGKWTAEKPA